MKGCMICHARALELDSTGRCPSCARVKRAADLGISYGNLVAKEYQEHPWEIPPVRELEPLPPDAPIPKSLVEFEKNCTVVCAICGREFQSSTNRAMYCSHECQCTAARLKARQRKERRKREKEEAANAL